MQASTVSFRMPPLTEAINSHCTGGSTVGSEMDTVEGTREKWVTVEGEFVLAGITQVRQRLVVLKMWVVRTLVAGWFDP